MKKQVLFLFLSIIIFSKLNAQWCVPTSAIPYNANMPGITHIIINTIDRVSSDLENYPANSYVNTGLSTSLIKGVTYDISISFTVDASICPDMNLRVWIDFNHDGQLDDIGETVITANNQLPGTYIGSFTIPSTATAGITRMRITAKMSPAGGHTMPTPCDVPADPLGYHGEIEDYDVEIIESTGISSPSTGDSFVIKSSAEKMSLALTLNKTTTSSLQLTDVQGRIIKNFLFDQVLAAGEYTFDCPVNNAGIYFAVLNIDERKIVRRIVAQ